VAVTSGRPCPEPRWRQRPMQVSLSLSVPSHDVLLLLSFGTLALWGAGLSLGNDTIVKVLLWHISGWKMFLHPTPAMEDASARSAPAAKFLYRLRYRTRLSIFQQHSGGGGGGGGGTGEILNGKIWHNKEVPHYAVVFFGPKPFLWVSLLALLACTFPWCPRSLLRYGKRRTRFPWK